MVVQTRQIFNLMDTNGRRSDVLNALKIYLEILEELKNDYPTESWGAYPSSLLQFLFYEKALEKSKDVFKKHDHYDEFRRALGQDYQKFINRDDAWVNANFSKLSKILDEAIEQRARHYTSNLVKMGFATGGRRITPAGYSYLRGSVVRDDLESILPLDNVNILLLRQLAKLKIFSASHNGKRQYYSPFLMALVLLLDGDRIEKGAFETIVQGLTPYSGEAIKAGVRGNSVRLADLETAITNIVIPDVLAGKKQLEYTDFQTIFKGSKDNAAITKMYYGFFRALQNFRNNKDQASYAALMECLDGQGAASLNKAFGEGEPVFAAGNKGSRYSLEKFLQENARHSLLTSDDYISAFYAAYCKSKWLDGIREYSDTTIRLLSATGLFKFENLLDLSYKNVLSQIFDVEQLRKNIFGEMTEAEYEQYETAESCYLGKNTSLAEILNYSPMDVAAITQKIRKSLGVSTAGDVKKLLDNSKREAFEEHIHHKYTKEKIMELLPLFSDRKKDPQIKKAVNEAATVPTIYEYVIGIAWYYISNEGFDLYSSLNLTLNADFEPVIHAGGGAGDIVIHYKERIVMLEVTLMNQQAQKRGEWEPVLRHSLNLKAANEPKETITFFIADTLDYNTINIWRAVAAVSLESTNTHAPVNGVVIMPLTNKELLTFLEENIDDGEIVRAVKRSFAKVPQITDLQWREDLMDELTGAKP